MFLPFKPKAKDPPIETKTLSSKTPENQWAKSKLPLLPKKQEKGGIQAPRAIQTSNLNREDESQQQSPANKD